MGSGERADARGKIGLHYRLSQPEPLGSVSVGHQVPGGVIEAVSREFPDLRSALQSEVGKS